MKEQPMADSMIQMTRRDLVAVTAAFTLVGKQALAQAAGVEMARGMVFEDADGSGQRGRDSKGVAGVMVSNGREVVLTDGEGKWSLAVTPGQSLFVIKPRDWALPVDEATQLPRFAYLHHPQGTDAGLGFRFAGVAPTGVLPGSIDFALRRASEGEAFNALLFTDPQPESVAELGFVRDDVVAHTDGVEAAFGITTGDLMFDDLAYYGRYNRMLGTIGVPWFSCPGNHDMNFESPDNARSRDTWKRVFGSRDMAFQHGAATFVVLDNVEYLGTDASKPNGSGKYRGVFSGDQLAFVRNVLAHVARDSLVVFCFHIPLRTLAGTSEGFAVTNVRAFLEAISTHTNTVSFSGHTHTNEHWYFGADEGYSGGVHHHQVLAAVSGSWWSGPLDERGIPIALQTDGAPNGFHVLAVDGRRYTTTLVPARDPNRSMIRVVLDSQLHGDAPEVIGEYAVGALLAGPIDMEALGSTRVVANFFPGGPRSVVEMAVGRRSFVAMTRVERTDPFVVEVYARNGATKKSWVKPEKSSHVWQGGLPEGLGRGTHRVRVRGTDEYGRVHVAGMVLEVG